MQWSELSSQETENSTLYKLKNWKQWTRIIIIIIIIHTFLWHWLDRLMREIYAMCVEWTKFSEI